MSIEKNDIHAFSILMVIALTLLSAYAIDKHYSARPALICDHDEPNVCLTASGEWASMMTESEWNSEAMEGAGR